ncbi:MAG: RHS repeat-associated core domain-containing protein [Prevotella sp.]|nr:RHS repeat-associated core domain-containing protein [Prevotella sp.]
MNTNTIKTHLFLLIFLPFALGIQAQSSRNYVSATERHDGGGTLTTYQYYDEAGRPSGTVQVGVTPDGSNLMDMTEYDGFGRKIRQWLPVATAQIDMTSSSFQSAVTISRQDSRPYVETAYEASPLGRPLSETRQGAQWNIRPKTTDYLVNTTSYPLSCKDYYVSMSGTLSERGIYPAGWLRVVKLTDEDRHVSYEFRDLQDRLLLRRRMLSSSTSADTYYAYDIRGDLRYVLQPGYQHDNDLGRLAFQYDYDNRHNVIRRKMPGASEQRLAYDKANRLTFSQDGNQRTSSRLSFWLYDNLGRVVLQGQCDGTGLPDMSGTAVSASFSLTEGIGGTGYTSNITLTNARIEQAHYYDTYAFLSLPLFSGAGFTAGEVSARGQETGSIVAVLSDDADVSSSMPSPASLLSAYHYDIKGRQTLSQATNMLGGKDVTSTEYGYLLPARTIHTHTAEGQPTQVVEQTYTYDHADRLTSSAIKLDDGEPLVLHADSYDDYGRLSSKRLMDSETIRYSYNIHDWLTQIASENFTEDLFYCNGPTKPSFNGNIIWQRWKVGNEPELQRNFLYNYDELDRLTCATYGEGIMSFDNRDRYTTQYSYDKNGNMLTLKRKGLQDDGGYSLIDDVAMQYDGNRLSRATDDVDGPFYASAWHFRDGADEDEEYQYDENGNLTQDLNSNISLIEYNFLNLPSKIEFMDGSTTWYTYDATGRKLRAEYHKGGEQDTLRTDYCGNLIYEQGRPHMLLVDGGYVTFNVNDNGNVNDSMQWHYYLKDHLGNNRVVVNTNDSIEQVNHYYPYGGLMAESIGGDAQRYKYNGKELDRMHGLDWMDYGARWMNGLTFTTQDRYAEKYYETSPYMYCQGNPMKYRDINGDSLNLSNMIYSDRQNSTNNVERLTQDLSLITGLSLSVSDGYMQYEKDDDGNPVYSKGSETARGFLINIINGSNIDVYATTKRSVTPNGGTQVGLSSAQINEFIVNANNLDKETMGWGMTLLHELYHTASGGSLKDTNELYGTGDVVDKMNVIRAELNKQGRNFGQRLNYKSIIIDEGTTTSYIPFDNASLNSIKNGYRPSRKYKFIKIDQ